MCAAKSHVRFTLISDRESGFSQTVMSALPPKAHMCSALAHVRLVPEADIADPSFDYIVGPQKDRRWDVDAQYFGRL
jgi:hypothetical protein